MKAKFIGDPANGREGPRVLRLYGRVFPKGRFVGIQGADAEAVFAKLSANSHFETGDGEGEADLTPVEPEITAEELADDGQGSDGRDIESGSSTEKDAVIARLKALQEKHPEVEYDGRWGLPKLQAALEAAEFEHAD